ncbi:hypothetical protein RHSIM_Rhsim02G0078500 [Rhododendron simsii]|uniref:Rx N-terminal domain-containing protein n=1 Tax=Rhododendron simsii TaxID=118357 RepID=A0A834HDE3_RHOSS|nr:hypothetical protein RHSIM_Rhsim02G0078500 [Rhododendron simsii]
MGDETPEKSGESSPDLNALVYELLITKMTKALSKAQAPNVPTEPAAVLIGIKFDGSNYALLSQVVEIRQRQVGKIDVMALVAVSSAINSTLVPFLSREVNLLWNIHSEVSSIKDELESIVSFLKNADSNAESENGEAKVWVQQVRAVAYQIEDVMDEYILHLAKNRQRCGFLCFLHELVRSITELKLRHDLASQIKDMKRTIRDIKERADSNFKLVKVLDLQGAHLNQLHEEVGNLLHLQYLSVKRTKVQIIPKSIGNLHNLQTLNLKESHVSVLRIGILSRLRKLRHLIGNYGVEIQGGIGHLEELQTLKKIMANNDLIKELENLRQLRKLSIKDVKREHANALYTAIEKMNHLQSLEVEFIQGNTILDLHSLSSPPKSLQRLYLIGHLEMSPNWISRLDNLVSLVLTNSWLTGAHAIKALQALPNLIKLSLYHGYDGEQLYFDVGGFPKLKSLYLLLLELNSIVIEEGGLPVLEVLVIRECPQLKEVPSGIRNLTKLKSLRIICMPTEFYDRMRPDKGQDYRVIEHIPKVQFAWNVGRVPLRMLTPREFQDVRESLRLNGESQEVLLPTCEVKEIHVQDDKEFQCPEISCCWDSTCLTLLTTLSTVVDRHCVCSCIHAVIVQCNVYGALHLSVLGMLPTADLHDKAEKIAL